MITVGFASTRTGRKAHRHCNGYAFCGAGKLIGAPREIAESDQLCQRCAPWISAQLADVIDTLDRHASRQTRRDLRSGLTATVRMLVRFVESGRRMVDIHAEALEMDKIRSILIMRFDERDAAIEAQFERRPVPDYADAGWTLF